MNAPAQARWEARQAAEEALPNAECDNCTRCADRCTESVPMTQEEYARIARFLGRRPVPPEPSRPSGEMAAPCRFLAAGSRLCLIYPVRPLACRLFGLTPWWPCPASRFEPKLTDADRLLALYCELPRAPFEEWRRAASRPKGTTDG